MLRFPDDEHKLDSINRVKDFLSMFRIFDSPWDSQKSLRMITETRSYSLVDLDGPSLMYPVHPLAHALTRDTISNVKPLTLGMSTTWKYRSEHYAFRCSLQPHIDTLLKGGNSAGPEFSAEFALVYSKAGRRRQRSCRFK